MGQKHWDMGNARSVAISVEYFEQAIAADPAFARGYARLAGAYLTHARLSATSQAEYEKFAQKARHAANKAIELDEDSAAAISVLARLTDHPELQAQLLERALELEPDHIPSLNRYAMLVLQPAGRQAEAAELFRRILEISPLDANNRSELGFALWELGYHEEAIAQVEKSIELQPDMMQNYHWLGFRMYFEYGRLDEAVLLHRLSFSVSPETFREAASVATAYAGLGMREEALAFLEKAVDIMGWTPVVNFQAGLTYERLGDDDVSLDYYMRFVETYADKQHPDVLEFVIEDDLRAGRYEEALQRFRDASPDSTSDDVTVNEGNVWDVFQYGHLLGKGGHTEEARLRLQRVATFMASVCSEDDSNFACRLLWQVYAHLGDRKKTLEALRFSIIDKRYFANSHYLDDESLDFLRDDLEFRELMDYVDAEMDKQRSRIRKLECAGEVPPAPGIDISAFCP
jgi:tetratricopeptide (TPR) repeat protein